VWSWSLAHTIVEHYVETSSFGLELWENDTIRYDTIEEINVDSKAEYTA